MASKKKTDKTKIEQAADVLHETGEEYIAALTGEGVRVGASPFSDAEIIKEFRETMENAPVVFNEVNRPAQTFIYNRLASIEGYQGFGFSYRKDWEIEMALETLHDLGGAHPNANILGVGAGTERTIFELANAQSAALVTASDIYNDAGVWDSWHGKKFLQNPHAFAPAGLPYDRERVAVMHVDMCDMPFDDEVYDAVFSSGSIEHVGNPKHSPNWEQVAQAAKEIGRVLKKGGIASISTEFKVSGEGWGFEGVRLFTVEDLMKYIVEPSGLELVGDVDWEYHGDLADAVSQPDVVLGKTSEENRPLLSYGHFLFTSVHLALKKA